jgi:hypothetical protein
MNKHLLLALLMILQLPAFGQTIADRTELTDIPKVHAWITEMKSANISWFDQPRDRIFAQQYRLAVGASEIYHTLLIERIVYGNEGCCKQVDKIWQIDLMKVYLKYSASPEAPIKLGEWVTETKATFAIGNKHFSIDVTTDEWKIEPSRNGG